MMHTQSLKFFLKVRRKCFLIVPWSGHTVKLVICTAINGTELLNIFDTLEVHMSKRTARSLLRRPTLSFFRTTNTWSSNDNFLCKILILLFTLLTNHINLEQLSPVKNAILSSDLFKYWYENLLVLSKLFSSRNL